MLLMFGIDPNEARKAVEEAKLRKSSENSDKTTDKEKQLEINKTNTNLWTTWIE